MSAPQPLAVGMYVTMTGRSKGRIVDRIVKEGVVWWVVKLGTGIICRARSAHLTPRV